MKNKAYFIKNLARLRNLQEDDPQIVEYHDKQIVDILLAIKEAREHKKEDGDGDDDLWDRLSSGRI
jgi:hypothetical protein